MSTSDPSRQGPSQRSHRRSAEHAPLGLYGDPASLERAGLTRPIEVAPAAPPPDTGGDSDALQGSAPTLRPLGGRDRTAFLDAVHAAKADLDEWMPLHETEESDDELFDRQLRLTLAGDRDGSAWRRVLALPGGVIAGCFNLTRMDRAVTLEGDANWWVRSDLAGRGLATAGVRALLRHALTPIPDGLGLYRVTAGIIPGHKASARVATKCGMTRIEGLKAMLRLGGGAWVEHETYAMTADELENLKSAS